MSQLANIKRAVNAVLADPKRNGIYRLSECDFGFAQKLDGRALRSKKSLLAGIARALEFPDYFGENWDALDECLNDLEWLDGQAGALVITDAEQLLVEADGEAFGVVQSVTR